MNSKLYDTRDNPSDVAIQITQRGPLGARCLNQGSRWCSLVSRAFLSFCEGWNFIAFCFLVNSAFVQIVPGAIHGLSANQCLGFPHACQGQIWKFGPLRLSPSPPSTLLPSLPSIASGWPLRAVWHDEKLPPDSLISRDIIVNYVPCQTRHTHCPSHPISRAASWPSRTLVSFNRHTEESCRWCSS